LVCSTILFHSCRSCTFALQPIIFILFRSSFTRTCSNLHSDTTLLQPNRTNTPVHTETEQYTHTQSSAPEDECNNIRNMLSNKKLS
jgi:hypothetical protein